MQRSTTISGAFKLEPLTVNATRERVNSAQANLQSHPCFQSSLFNDNERAAGSIKLWKERFAATQTRLHANDYSKKKDYQLENVIWAQSEKLPRRLTINNVSNLADWEVILLRRQKSYALAALGELKGKPSKAYKDNPPLEEKMTLDALNQLNRAFLQADTDGSGTLDLDEFKEVVRNALKIKGRNDEEIASLFMKINFSSDGKITWDEFCTFMQLNYNEKEDTIKRQKEVIFITPARRENNPNRSGIQKVASTSDGSFIVMSIDGVFSFWSPTGDLKRIKRNVIEKRTVKKEKKDKQEPKRSRSKWMTDFLILSEFNKILIGTGDRELQFWELSSFEPYCQISCLDTVPIKLAYSYSGRDDVTIAYGDTDGCINILIFDSIGETLRVWKTFPLVSMMPNVYLDKALEKIKYTRWKTHNDWVEQIIIDKRLNQIISCSNDENHAVVIGCILPSTDINSMGVNVGTEFLTSSNTANQNQQQLLANLNNTSIDQKKALLDPANIGSVSTHAVSVSSRDVKRRPEVNETVFRVNKGVKAFDFCFEKNLLVTGGMDKIIRLYNPYVPSRPIAYLKSHVTPIFFIHLSYEENRIYSMSTDKCLTVWDTDDHCLLASIRAKTHKVKGDLQTCCYASKSKCLLINTDKISFLSLKLKSNLQSEVVLSHKEPVMCCLYNKVFKQLISCTEAGTVKLWDIETGRDIFEFSNAHDDQAITCMTFDDTGRRLITGGRDGVSKVWNFNNGHCLKILQKEVNSEVNDVKYTKIYNNKFIVNVGWDRSINVYDDDLSDVRVYSNPIARWKDDVANGHKEDIICLAKSESNFLATSSYDGEIIVWNMVSGHIFTKLISSKPTDHQDNFLDGDLSVNKLIFLNKEHFNEKSAHLISSGPWGLIHFWSIFHEQSILVRFPVSERQETIIIKMCVDSKYAHLFAADNYGFIYHWNIEGYAKNKQESQPPPLIKSWRAHTQQITSIDYVDSSRVLISCSVDCTIRVWTPDGKYIGTFGQDEMWNLYDPKTYKHPLVPYDVLVDDQSMPEHPILNNNETFQKLVENEDILAKKPADKEVALKTFPGTKNVQLDDDAIASQVNNMKIPDKVGKRLRHELNNTLLFGERAYRNYYQTLKIHDVSLKPIELPTSNAIADAVPFYETKQ